ncbi:MAG: HAMP domain-containing histidine kinase [Gammaproteobacteria bacterium]|nr:HAMP domain-containing histidine kinase [Gammaproteobacteria bacterium]
MRPYLVDRRALTATLLALAVMVVAFVLGFSWLQIRIMEVHDRELYKSVRRELMLRKQFEHTAGRESLIQGLKFRNEVLPGYRYFALIDPSGKPLAGELGRIPQWQRVLAAPSTAYRVNDEAGGATYVVSERYRDGVVFVVTQQSSDQVDIAKALGRAAVLTVLAVILIGVATAVVLNRYVLDHVRSLAATARQIMRGQMAARVPAQQRLDAMGALATTFNEMLDQNDALVTGMRTVTESLAHDLRAPLGRVRRSIAAARIADSEAVREQLLNDAELELGRALQTFNSLVDLARAEAGLSRDSMEELDLGVLASDMAELLEPLAEERGQSFECSIEPVTVVGHRQILAQALGNLIENAIKYSPVGSALKLAVRAGGQGAGPEIVVQDSGPGIPINAREQAVRPFVRLETSRQPGSGLGLAIAAAVARLHRGRLVLENAEPGLRVRLQFGAPDAGWPQAAIPG